MSCGILQHKESEKRWILKPSKERITRRRKCSIVSNTVK
jgi:hypothetical protein